jgi:RNA-directed DNA polymerase
MNLKDALDKTTVLQSKLYQAAKDQPGRRFHQLYDKLFREDVLWIAWKQVRDNGGSAGIDGVTIKSIEESDLSAYLGALGAELHRQTYSPQPLRRVWIPKGNGKMRELGIPTVRDRIVQAAAKLVLEPIFEADFGSTSFGFRPGLGQPDALAAIDQNARAGLRFVVDADIEGFFDNLDHEQLMDAVRRRISDGAVLRLIYRWLKAGVYVGFSWEPTDQGTPQGGVISPLLANVYLHSLDEAAEDRSTGFTGRITRYADDLVIQCGTRVHAERALIWLRSALSGLGLRLNAQKTAIVSDDREGYDFLGFHHRRVVVQGSGAKRPMRWPSRKSCQRFRDRIKEILHRSGGIRGGADWRAVESDLNAYIRGWGHYFRRSRAWHVLKGLDWYVGERIGRYLARCQPKGKKRKRRHWQSFTEWLWRRGKLARLGTSSWNSNPHRGLANVRWKAV